MSDDIFNVGQQSLFTIHGTLDGDAKDEFREREQFIGLRIGQEEFLLPLTAIHEIIMLTPITYVPNGPEFIDGVINLRGTIIPAINMRKLLGVPRGKPSGASRIIITRFDGVTFGLLVDGITNVISLLPSEIENQALPGKGTGAEFIGGISKHGSSVAGILDLARILKNVAGTLSSEDDGNEPDTHAA